MNKYVVTVAPVRFPTYEEEVTAETEREAIDKAIKIGYERDHPSPKPLVYAYDATAELVKDPEAVIAPTPPAQKFRRISPIVYAIQWFPGMNVLEVDYKKGANPEAWLTRIYGKQTVNAGDWIVKGPDGRVNALPNKCFHQEYEEA